MNFASINETPPNSYRVLFETALSFILLGYRKRTSYQWTRAAVTETRRTVRKANLRCGHTSHGAISPSRVIVSLSTCFSPSLPIIMQKVGNIPSVMYPSRRARYHIDFFYVGCPAKASKPHAGHLHKMPKSAYSFQFQAVIPDMVRHAVTYFRSQ